MSETEERETLVSLTQDWPDWRSDLLRRLYTHGELTSDDYDELVFFLKVAHGLEPRLPERVPSPFTAAHARHREPSGPRVVLVELRGVCNTGRLASDQILRFGLQGITVIYGPNASGKSGYASLLKAMCGALARPGDSILSNVYERLEGEAQATVRYRVGDQAPSSATWIQPDEPISDLRGTPVFDSTVAELYVDRANPIRFQPYDMSVLRRVGRALSVIGDRLSSEQQALIPTAGQVLPAIPDTEVGSLIARLSRHHTALPDESEIRALGEWTDELDTRIDELTEAVENDPRSLAWACERTQEVVREITSSLQAIEGVLSDAALDEFRASRTGVVESEQAASLAARQQLADAPLPQVGGDAWRTLFTHARAYSGVAYPNQTFPVTGEERRCVLCQQLLQPEASARLQSFDAYICGEAARVALGARRQLEATKQALRTVAIPTVQRVEVLIGQTSREIEEERAAVVAYLADARERRRDVLQVLDHDLELPLPPVAALGVSPVPVLLDLVARLESERAGHLVSADDREQSARNQNELRELKARKQLSPLVETVVEKRNAFARLRELDRCIEACGSWPVSDATRRLRRVLVTPAWRRAFEGACRTLDLQHLPPEVHDNTQEAQSRVGVRLRTAQAAVANSRILSEGESRAVALACFLADAALRGEDATLVLDDPVSSFDHARRARLAETLVREAATRQVVVFTHDLAFFHELMVGSGTSAPPVPFRSSRVGRELPGQVGYVSDGDGPREATSTEKRIRRLERLLETAQASEPRQDEMFERDAVFFYTTLRKAWERLVEKDLLNEVVTRFSPVVHTLKLRQVAVEDAVYYRITRGMTRASRYSGHDAPLGTGDELPTGERMATDLADLKEVLGLVKSRRTELARERPRPDMPPAGPVDDGA